jgi:REP element-mobilizing transposase RayT
MAPTYPDVQIHCLLSPKERCERFPDALREKISMYLIGIGHNQSLPILCARATDHYVHLLIAVPRGVTLAQAMLLLEGEFLTLAAQTPIRFRLTGQLQPRQRKRFQDWSGQASRRPSERISRKKALVPEVDSQSARQD